MLTSEVEKIFSFLSTRSYKGKISAKTRDLRQHLKDTKDLCEEKQQLYLGLDHINVSLCLLTSTQNINCYLNAFNYWVTVRIWQKDICDMPKSTKYSGISLRYFLSDSDLIIIFCQLGWQVAQLFPPLGVSSN